MCLCNALIYRLQFCLPALPLVTVENVIVNSFSSEFGEPDVPVSTAQKSIIFPSAMLRVASLTSTSPAATDKTIKSVHVHTIKHMS